MPAANSIFISYRRSDSNDVTGRICDRLKAHFGEEAVFIDYDDIPYGEDFPDHLQKTVDGAKVLLAIIGPTWLDVLKKRMEKPKTDWVRSEIERALSQGVLVIPVLVNGGKVPEAKELPPGLKALPRKNSPSVRAGADFDTDMQRLIEQLEARVAESPGTVVLSRSDQLELERLRDELQDQERDYKTVTRDLKVELDGVTKNKLKDRLAMIVEEMDVLEKQIDAIAQGHGTK